MTTIDLEHLPTRAGRPRDPACDAAILQAALDAFVEEGYAGVSMEGVAARAGVGKATVYRRYSSKAQLVVDAVRCGVQLEDHLPDTGNLRDDLASILQPLLDRLRGPEAKVMITFAVERFGNPDLDEEFTRSVIGKKREHIARIIALGIERGDLPPTADAALIAEVPSAVLWHHALYGLPIDEDLLERTLDLVLPRA